MSIWGMFAGACGLKNKVVFGRKVRCHLSFAGPSHGS